MSNKNITTLLMFITGLTVYFIVLVISFIGALLQSVVPGRVEK